MAPQISAPPTVSKAAKINKLCLIRDRKKSDTVIGCLDDAVVPNQDRYWFGPSVTTNNFVLVQTFGSVQPGPPHHLGPGPIQVLFRSLIGITSPSKHFVSVQGRINIYLKSLEFYRKRMSTHVAATGIFPALFFVVLY